MKRKALYKIQEKIYKLFFILTDYAKSLFTGLSAISNFIFSVTSVFFIAFFCFHIGFFQEGLDDLDIASAYKIIFLALFTSKYIQVILNFSKRKLHHLMIDFVIFCFGLAILWFTNYPDNITEPVSIFFTGEIPILSISFLLIFTEANKLFSVINSFNIPAALLFVSSFLIIILVGSVLLMLPNAHTQPISYLDALFTSTSAVCVTGLLVVDTSTMFTTTGQIIILSLIQIGGLGIMTFTGFLGYIFTGSASFRERFMLRDLLSSENLGSLFKILTKIIMFTFFIELIGAVVIYLNTPEMIGDKFLFSIFHSISAFCNAGFSTLPEGLFTSEVRTSYSIHMTIAFLIVLGGIGFPVILSLYQYFKRLFTSLVLAFRGKKTTYARNRNINNSMVLTTTLILLLVGMFMYFWLEKDNSLRDLSAIQKIAVTFFCSVSARTAGFNVADISLWGYPTIFLMIFLMWVGASPGSTGGGIKTTTFAIALRAAWNFIRGNTNLEVQNRTIGSGTIIRVLAVIILSIGIIFIGFMALLISEPAKNPVHLLFESFSAFGTVGLSLVHTSTLNEYSKWIVIFLMFIGRVGPLTLLTGIFITNRKKYYKYPVQDVIIN
ncbi:MAG: potassium transporter TrkG [Prolixibacteraceae bacterium]|jgi:potassium uptake TrkH family protein